MIVTCTSCKRAFRTARSKVGLYAQCPNCGSMCRTTPADSIAADSEGSESSEAVVVLTTAAAFVPKAAPAKVPEAPALMNTSPRSPVKRSSELRLLLISILLAVIVTPLFVAWRLGVLWSRVTIVEPLSPSGAQFDRSQ